MVLTIIFTFAGPNFNGLNKEFNRKVNAVGKNGCLFSFSFLLLFTQLNFILLVVGKPNST